MSARAVWVVSPLFDWQIAVCRQCTEPLMRLKNRATNRYAYYCPICRAKHDEIVEQQYQHRAILVNAITE